MEQAVAPFEFLTPPADATSFTVDGVTYTMTDGLLVGRGRYLDKMVTEALYSTNMTEHGKNLAALREAMNKVNFVEAAALVQRFIDGHNMVAYNRLRAVEICGLFFNAENEDPSVYDFQAMQQKCYGPFAKVHRDFFFQWSLRLWDGGKNPYAATEAEGQSEALPRL